LSSPAEEETAMNDQYEWMKFYEAVVRETAPFYDFAGRRERTKTSIAHRATRQSNHLLLFKLKRIRAEKSV
jgi:hypothetical protein